jgi:hypothetical protein
MTGYAATTIDGMIERFAAAHCGCFRLDTP